MGVFNELLGNAGSLSSEKVQEEYGDLLIDMETVEIGFKVIRDVLIFTDKRLIFIDKQGVTGKKIEYLSILYHSITRFSIETAGNFDLDAELKIWVSSESTPSIQKRFDKKTNIYQIQKVLASHLM